MNIFILDEDPGEAARLQCDVHINKMIVESGQMLSTAHRMLDGYVEKRPSKSGKTMVNYWVHPDPLLESKLYKAVHHGHPCTVWTMESVGNYMWHLEHLKALCSEWEYRYGRPDKPTHGTKDVLLEYLESPPINIPDNRELTPFKLAMKSNPECMFEDDAVKSYRAFYQTKQDRFKMAWTKRQKPEWFQVLNAA